MGTRREKLDGISLVPNAQSHAGLWLDKFIENQSREDKEARRRLVGQVAGMQEPENYGPFFESWERSLTAIGAQCGRAKVAGRMVVGLGAEGVLEASVALHRTYGVPYIPGSALKGLAAAFARQHCGDDWQKGADFYNVVFGETEDAGYVTFYDALYVPGSGPKGAEGIARPLWADVMAVHHQDYYRGVAGNRGDVAAPADWDDPNPVPFLSAAGEYLIALVAPAGCEEWRRRAFDILGHALWHAGVGAKTSSGYGRLRLGDYAWEAIGAGPSPAAAPVDEEGRKADELVIRVRAVLNKDVPGRIGTLVDEWRRLTGGDEHRRRVAAEIIGKVRESGHEKAWREKAWYKELLSHTG